MGDGNEINQTVRTAILSFFVALLAGLSHAQEKVVQTFDGTTEITTPSFPAQDKWEVRWDCPDVISVTVLSADNTIVSGASGSLQGSLYLPKGGNFHLQITRGTKSDTSPWHVSVAELGSDPHSSDTNVATNYVPPQPTAAPESTNATTAPVAASPIVATPTTPSPPSPAVELTEDQAHAVVVVKGDVAEGTGFLVKTPDGPAVVTNLHVISANPNVRILTTTGAQIKTLSLKGASDRDLAMYMIQDDHYTYLDLATDIKDTVIAGDAVITPGNSEGGEVVLNTKGKVLGIGPDRIEFDNPIYHGNSGGPVFHTKSGKVLAVVTQALKVNVSNDLDKTSFANANSAIVGSMRYFGLRLDTVPQWEVYDWNRFQDETTFLKNFHEDSRCLDSFMNGASYEKNHIASDDPETGHPNAQYFLHNEKLQAARENYRKVASSADNSERLDAGRELLLDLQSVADKDMEAIQAPGNFYSFDQIRAKQEIAYRKALRAEIETVGNKLSDLGH